MKIRCKHLQAQMADEGPQSLSDDEAAQAHLVECDQCFSTLEALSAIEEGLGAMPELEPADTLVERARTRALDKPLPPPNERRWWIGLSAVAAAVVVVTTGTNVMQRGAHVRRNKEVTKKPLALIPEVPRDSARVDSSNVERQRRPVETPPTINGSIGTRSPDFGKSANQAEKEQRAQLALPSNGPSAKAVKAEKKAYTTRTVIDFEDEDIEGELEKPSGDYLLNRRATERPKEEADRTELLAQLRKVGKSKPKAKPAPVLPLPPSPPEPIVSNDKGGEVVFGRRFETERDQHDGDKAGKLDSHEGLPTGRHRLDIIEEPEETAEEDDMVIEKDLRGHATLREALAPSERFRGKKKNRTTLKQSEDRRTSFAIDTPALDLDRTSPHSGYWYDSGQKAGQRIARNEASNLIRSSGEESARANGALQRFLSARDEVKGLQYQEAAGYWRNTYVPGDPSLRRLRAQLQAQKAQVPEFAQDLERQAQLYPQPLDQPQHAALALSLRADKSSAEGPQRMLLQLGLQAADLHSRRRPPMNVALVVHLPPQLSPDEARNISALVTQIARHKQLGDAFSLTIAGRPGRTMLTPKAFDYGRVAVRINQALQNQTQGPAYSLLEALRAGYQQINPKQGATLGTSTMLLISPENLGAMTGAITRMAHRQALQGNLTSIVGVSQRVVPQQLSKIALAGQGEQLLLERPSEAASVVQRALSAASRVVARAVRLKIRLSAGVRLVGILGSERLDTQQAERVRQMEKSIDRRLSATMGIASDRGKDQAGIQIVIPSFYSGDAHVVLLDVVAPGPGPIAEASVQYKDLAFLKNGHAQAHLSLARGQQPRGPMQWAVLKNLVAHRVSGALTQASSQMARSDRAAASSSLNEMNLLLSGLMTHVPAWAQDGDLRQDARMLKSYSLALKGPQKYLSSSLAASAKLKHLPKTPEPRFGKAGPR